MSYIGTNKIGKMYLGSTEIEKAYLGSDLVYEKAGAVTETTVAPTISTEETSSAVVITASGNGTISLKINGVAQTNPYSVSKQNRISSATASATAQESGKLVSQETTLVAQIPPLGSVAGLNPSGSWTDNVHFATAGNGTESDSNSCISPYIPITGGQRVAIYTSGTNRVTLVEYNSNKSKVDYWGKWASERTITTNSNTRYIRFSVYYDTATTAYYKNVTTNQYYFKGTNVT